MTKLGPRRPCLRASALLGTAALLFSASSAGARPASTHPLLALRYATIRWSYARASHKVPHRLLAAAYATRRADSAFVLDALKLRRCVRAHRRHRLARCGHKRAQLQVAGHRLRRAQRRLAAVGGSPPSGGPARHGRRAAPALHVSGCCTLAWPRVDGVDYYVLVAKVPGRAPSYSLVHGKAVTPPPVPGETVRYTVRTSARGSAWAPEVAIAYPAAKQGSPGAKGQGADPQAAPQLSAEGMTLHWNQIGSVGTYILLTRAPGRADVYSTVPGTSYTPAAVPGATVVYAVRTAVEGSTWSREVSIAYPASPPPPSKEETRPGLGEEPSSGPAHMDVALDIGGWDWESAIKDEAGAVHYVRSSYTHFATDSQMALLARNGVTLMPLFGAGGTLASYDSPTFAAEIVSWFKRYGKGGTFWAGRPVDLGATTCELINEPGNPYFYPDYSNYALYAAITKLVKGALEANFPQSVRPKLLVSYDGGYNGSAYGKAIFAAGAVADGVTVHPYGGHVSSSALGNRERVTQAHAETGLPVYITEIGWPTATGQPPTGDSLQWTEQQQAENLTNFMNWARSLGYVADVTYFNYADYGTNNWYGIVDSTGSRHKLSYEALRAESALG